MSTAPLLEVDNLVAGYGATQVVQGLSLRVAAGGVTALLGANGAGKTTLMKALAGLVPVSGGHLRFQGAEITHSSCDKRVLGGMVLVPEGRMVFPSLSVQENLRLGGINPTLGLAPVMTQQIFELVRRLGADGLTLLLAEQDVQRTLEVAQQAYVIENGRVATHGPAREIGADPRIRQAYLGL